MPAFLEQPGIVNILETLEKLFFMIQSGCSIYSHFLKPLHLNIHELLLQALIVIKIILHSFFLREPVKLDPRLADLKIFMIIRIYSS